MVDVEMNLDFNFTFFKKLSNCTKYVQFIIKCDERVYNVLSFTKFRNPKFISIKLFNRKKYL